MEKQTRKHLDCMNCNHITIKTSFLVFGLHYILSFGNISKSFNNLQILWMSCVSISLLCAMYSRWDTENNCLSTLNVFFCLQVLSTGSKEMMVLHSPLFMTRSNIFYYIVPLFTYIKQAKPRQSIIYSEGINLGLGRRCRFSSS